jgi:ketosteroid isomerase-like protein
MSDIVHILDRGYELIWREHRLEDVLGILDAEFEWHVPDYPEGEVRQGPEAVIAFFREWGEPFEDMHVEWEIIEAGRARALALIDMRGRGRESGVPVEMRFAQLWTFEGGRAKRMDFYSDVDEGRAAAGL